MDLTQLSFSINALFSEMCTTSSFFVVIVVVFNCMRHCPLAYICNI